MPNNATLLDEIKKGLWKENPVLVLLLGMCPTLAVTTTAFNGLGMGLSTTFVLICSNIIIAVIKPIVPKSVRIPIFIVVIATFVSLLDLSLKAYMFDLSRSLGLFVPLIVVNCIILGRAEAFASRNSVLRSALDGLGMAIGFTVTLFVLGAIREIIGTGTLTLLVLNDLKVSFALFGDAYPGVTVMILPPGAFIGLGMLLAIRNKIQAGIDAGK
jgi:Na+-translocating ferredoxin:NAD+ oxidoreductase subunit E